MKQTLIITLLALALTAPTRTAGQSIWCIEKRIGTNLDLILNAACSGGNSCAPTPISTATTISTAGSYCLATTISGTITIQSDNVVLDLSGRTITGSPGIAINTSACVMLRNGTVNGATGTDAIIATDCQTLVIDSVSTKNSANGVHLIRATKGTIIECDFSAHDTGLKLEESTGIQSDSCRATGNRISGFAQEACHNNQFNHCTAFNNGSQSPTDGFGFVSTNGSGNLFEHCTADATRTATTNFCNVAAGFALLGTEQCSKIVDCSACTAFGPFTTEQLGSQTVIQSARPHGILLESISTKTLLPFASIDTGDAPNTDSIYTVNWSADGKYLAVGGSINGNDIIVYAFGQTASNPLVQIASIATSNPDSFDSVFTLQWSPDGTYLAAGGSITPSFSNLLVYEFNPTALAPLTRVASINTNTSGVLSLDWSPNGNYLAIGEFIIGSLQNAVSIYQFNQCPLDSAALIKVASVSPGGNKTDTVQTVRWSPNGNYLAIGGRISGATTNNDLLIYQFATNTLTQITSVSTGSDTDIVSSLDWSPDGKYLAVFGPSSADTLKVYQFDPSQPSASILILFDSVNLAIPLDFIPLASVNWSADGKYLAVGGTLTNSNDILIYQFNPSDIANSLTLIASLDPAGAPSTDMINSVNWAPDGTYLAVGGTIAGNDLIVYQFDQQFPTKNFIQNNTTTCNMTTSTQCPRGTGISGSSIQNCIIGNTAYNNPFNYTFVTNTFSQLLQGNASPSTVQNVDLIGCAPICTPNNLGTLAWQNFQVACKNQDTVQLIIDALP